ncbi:MAG: hypothetical protein SFU83_21320 [Meiothermus sp.]|nr:hypothetical protein [Meiothermus sp.]
MQLLLDTSIRAVLEPFILEALTIKAVAVRLGRPLNAVHHRVQQFERLGLLEVERLEQRQGRAIKHYQAVAKGFFIPFTATDSDSLSQFLLEQLTPLTQHLIHKTARSGQGLIQDIAQVGLRVYDGGGFVSTDFSPEGQEFDFFNTLLSPESPALMFSVFPLRLSRADAKALQLEMVALIEKYSQRSGPEPYLAQIALVPE